MNPNERSLVKKAKENLRLYKYMLVFNFFLYPLLIIINIFAFTIGHNIAILFFICPFETAIGMFATWQIASTYIKNKTIIELYEDQDAKP